MPISIAGFSPPPGPQNSDTLYCDYFATALRPGRSVVTFASLHTYRLQGEPSHQVSNLGERLFMKNPLESLGGTIILGLIITVIMVVLVGVIVPADAATIL